MKYKVVQWATGSVGMWALREVIRNPDLELVGLRVYNPNKVGVDAGEIAGVDVRTGITGTDRNEDILKLDADVVIHCAMAFGQKQQMLDDVVALLESGKNVVIVGDYIAPWIHGEATAKRLRDAALKGGVTLHGTGIDPGFFCDRLPATLTCLSTQVDHIRMQEIADLRGHPNPSMIIDLLGFGIPADKFVIDPSNPGVQYCAEIFPQALYALFDVLRVPLDRVDILPPRLALATRDLQVASGTIRKGSVAGITWIFEGYRPSDEKGKPFATHEWSWYVEAGLPGMPAADNHYQIRLDIEGTPTLRTVLDITHPEDPFFMPTAGAAIRAIPDVVAAAPGHFVAPVFGPWMPNDGPRLANS